MDCAGRRRRLQSRTPMQAQLGSQQHPASLQEVSEPDWSSSSSLMLPMPSEIASGQLDDVGYTSGMQGRTSSCSCRQSAA
jgi:hypothetical protein